MRQSRSSIMRASHGQYEPNAKSLQWLFTYDGIPSQSSMAARVITIAYTCTFRIKPSLNIVQSDSIACATQRFNCSAGHAGKSHASAVRMQRTV